MSKHLVTVRNNGKFHIFYALPYIAKGAKVAGATLTKVIVKDPTTNTKFEIGVESDNEYRPAVTSPHIVLLGGMNQPPIIASWEGEINTETAEAYIAVSCTLAGVEYFTDQIEVEIDIIDA